jgi:hypothetical protein
MSGAEWMWHAVGLLAVLLAAVAVPWAGMRMLKPSLAEVGRTVRNYRGRDVPLGLGLVWVFWAVALAAHQVLALAYALPHEYTASLWFEITIAVPLVLGAFMFGLIDDTFGTAGHKGFGGHLSALRRGRLTTGALKLFGIGFLALLGAALPAFGTEGVTPRSIAHYIVAVLVIGLAANTVNLFDLRPGRALKAYSMFVVVSVPAGVWSLVVANAGPPLATAALDGLLVLVVALGPVLAVWRQDVREEGMLGDAGANAFGMLAGLLLVSALPFAGAVAAAAVLLAVNLASEKVSFSSVIERTPWLAALDRWGRPKDTPAP